MIEAALHDGESIASTPQWLELNWIPAQEQRLVNATLRYWYENQSECLSKEEGESCDEYPFCASAQGGDKALVRPLLRKIPSDQNTREGGRYGNMVTSCKMQRMGAYFVIPLIPESVPPSTGDRARVAAPIDASTSYLC
ncbi:NucA/NucB deoxyribonuclease domain-containing protein [Kineococcus arenarius]|uniref:NucA/NucB deoxyribonuclease domain-containing protein n=1 Tax=unclassified Kineococcus TaxID=2621656 RepID=UPI003D7DBD10